MNSATLLDNFDLLAEAPGGVPKLRELIFSLAITGKLVPNADSGSWQVVRLIDVGAVNPRNAAPDGTQVGFVPMKLISTDYRTPIQFEHRAWGEVKKAFTHLADGDVAVAKITPCFENGKACYVRGLPSGLGAGTTELHVFRPDGARILPEYALVFLKSPDFVRAGIPRMTGSAGQKRVPAEYFANVSFPLPPLPEQRRIVARVDELMALCDALEVRQEAAHKTQTALTRSALHHLTAAPDPAECSKRWTFICDNFQALEGRPENVTELRKAILQLAVAGRLVPYRGAEHWPTRRFDAIAKISGGVTKGRRLIGRRLIELPYLRVANVQRGFLDLAVVKTIAIASDELDRYRLLPEDVLIVEGGDWDKVGRAAIWRGEIDVCLHQNHIFRARVDGAVVRPEWVQLALNSSGGRAYFEGASKQTTNLASINMTQLRGFPVLLPSVEYQIKTLASVDALMKLCDELEAGLKRERADADRLFDAVSAPCRRRRPGRNGGEGRN